MQLHADDGRVRDPGGSPFACESGCARPRERRAVRARPIRQRGSSRSRCWRSGRARACTTASVRQAGGLNATVPRWRSGTVDASAARSSGFRPRRQSDPAARCVPAIPGRASAFAASAAGASLWREGSLLASAWRTSRRCYLAKGATPARRWLKRMGVQTNAEDPRIVYQDSLLLVLPTVALSVWRRLLHVRTPRGRDRRVMTIPAARSAAAEALAC